MWKPEYAPAGGGQRFLVNTIVEETAPVRSRSSSIGPQPSAGAELLDGLSIERHQTRQMLVATVPSPSPTCSADSAPANADASRSGKAEPYVLSIALSRSALKQA